MRLIDADELIAVCEILINTSTNGYLFEQAKWLAQDAPTIDAVPVVRCKDCKWWTKQEASLQGRCDAYGMYPTGAWYCARGERKDDE